MASSQQTGQAAIAPTAPLHLSRTWRSPVADVDFRTPRQTGQGQVEAEAIRGTGGVVITSESRRGNGAAVPSKITADEVTGAFGPDSALRSMKGVGHAGIEKTTATGTRQTASGDRLQAEFAEDREQGNKGAREQENGGGESGGSATASPGVQSAELDGHVVLFEQAAAKPGAQPQPAMQAWAGKAVYEGVGEWLHLTLSPRVEQGGLELTADKVDVSQQSGDAFAHGNVKATWTSQGATAGDGSPGGQAGKDNVALGGQGPAHVIAEEAQLHQPTGEATFRGHARLWQQANSVAGPLIVLDRQKQTLVARTTDATDPVKAVLLSAGATAPGNAASRPSGKSGAGQSGGGNTAGKTVTPSVIRVRGGDLWYSDAEHRAVMHGGALGAVVAETGTATSTSDEVELQLMLRGKS